MRETDVLDERVRSEVDRGFVEDTRPPSPDEIARSDGKRWWGNCIWDALGILASMHRDGRVSTSCPDCGEHLEAAVEDGAITGGTSIVHLALPAARWWDDIGST